MQTESVAFKLLSARACPSPAAFLFSGVLTGLNIGLISTFTQPDRSRALESDEFEEIFEEQAIGIELQDVRMSVRQL